MDDSDHDIKQVLPVFPAHLEIVLIYKLFDYISTGRTMLSRCNRRRAEWNDNTEGRKSD